MELKIIFYNKIDELNKAKKIDGNRKRLRKQII